jgi:3-hydroxyacyl-CoA dehydrogenase/enoyl-CoA hydratase/3-hydroxybutyryl-CoA epimerase
MFGIQNAFMTVLSQGTRFKPGKAKEIGLVDEVLPTVEELVPAARRGSRPTPTATPSRGMPRATRCPAARRRRRDWPASCRRSPRLLKKQLKGAPMPAPRAILDAAVEGAQVDFDTAAASRAVTSRSLVTARSRRT